MTDKQKKEEIKQVVTNLGNIKFTVEDELKFCKEVLKRKEQKCDQYKQALQEIKKIAEDECKNCTVKLLLEDEINCKRCYKTKILQKCEAIKYEH